jgi:hypothetical protein
MPQPGSTQADEILYESATTRVVRAGNAGQRLVRKEPLGPDAFNRLQHERQMLARLAGIQGIAQLAQSPAEALVFPDCGGRTLARVLREGGCDIDPVLSLAPRLARVVAAMHRAGVIHRDINPANILIDASGEPMLIDFDLALPVDESPASPHDGRIAGTLGYLAPEQSGRTGRTLDQRADLYALGATLYEMATRRPPFDEQDALQLIHDHLVRQPAAPCQVDARVPRGLSDIILRLLAKAPEQRYQSAEGLLHDLQRLRTELAQGQSGLFELGDRDFPLRLSAPAQLVGRDAQIAALAEALDDAQGRRSRVVLIEGAAGVGKTALACELQPIATSRGGWFVHGKYDQYQQEESSAGAATLALRMLGRLLLAEPKAQLDLLRTRILARLGRSAGVITRWLPEFALLLGAQPDAPDVDPRQAELQLHESLASLLDAIVSTGRPLVMMLDDLQWAGARSLQALSRVIEEPGLRGLLLVGLYRAEEVNANPLLAQWLGRLRGIPEPPLHLELGNLSADGMGELVARMLRLAPERAGELALAVGSLTGGNPFDTVEVLNALRHEGLLSLGEHGWQWKEGSIRRFVGGGNVVDLLAARIARLPQASRELLEFMSCLGELGGMRAAGRGRGDRSAIAGRPPARGDGRRPAGGRARCPRVGAFPP